MKSFSKAPMILAIDTSCDDTSAAVTSGVTVLSNVIASQTQLHKEYGGVFPTVAKQAHREQIDGVIALALRRAKVTWSDLTAVAVTQGPGLAPALEVGISKAKELAVHYHLPLVAVNHIEAHALSALAQPAPRPAATPELVRGRERREFAKISLPALAVVVSGGHTEFILIREFGTYERMGWTVDDAAGEALDKVGRMLGLGYPAGALMEQFARRGDPETYRFPLPMTTTRDFLMSFSGLKTDARNKIETLERSSPLTKEIIYHFAASFQRAIFKHILYKLNKVIESFEIEEIWLGGGVAANTELRRMIRELIKSHNNTRKKQKLSPIIFRVPYSKRLCMDNAAMIGVAAAGQWERHEALITEAEIGQLERRPRWEVSSPVSA